MTVHSAAALFLATLVFALIPGPGVSVVIAQSLSRGFKQGAALASGLVVGDFTYLVLALFGMGWVASQLGSYFVILKWTGAAYLIWLGVKCWLAKAPTPDAAGARACPPTRGAGRCFVSGTCVSLGNPKVIAFYCGFLPGFVNMGALTAADVALVIGIIIPTVWATVVGYAWLASRGGDLARETKLWKIANRSAGAVMIGTGVVLATSE